MVGASEDNTVPFQMIFDEIRTVEDARRFEMRGSESYQGMGQVQDLFHGNGALQGIGLRKRSGYS